MTGDFEKKISLEIKIGSMDGLNHYMAFTILKVEEEEK